MEEEEEEEVVSAALVAGKTRFFGGRRDGRGRLASLSMAGSQRHFRQGERGSLGSGNKDGKIYLEEKYFN